MGDKKEQLSTDFKAGGEIKDGNACSTNGKNINLSKARTAKNDEFYTQYADIEKEIGAYVEYNPDVFRGKVVLLPCDDPEWSNFTLYFAQNFKKLGLKKLISTSYAYANKQTNSSYEPSLFEQNSPQFDGDKSLRCGKLYELESDISKEGAVDIKDIKWRYLEGSGDFRSDEVKSFRDKADIIITNPPFSLFREFIAWIMETDKQFAVIGNKNCVTYKEIFPLIKENKLWSGRTEWSGGMWFETKHDDIDKVVNGVNMKNVPSIWITNIEHGRRHEPLKLMTMVDNKLFNKKIKGTDAYEPYDNYDAIEVPVTQAIPSDFKGAMGVPISFLDKYNPEQFEIVGATESEGKGFSGGLWDATSKIAQPMLNGNKVYKRIFIKINAARKVITQC